MTRTDLWNQVLQTCPLIAILRGVEPDNVIAIAEMLFETGFRAIEVPLNSPRPLASISLLATYFGDRALIGAGTVLTESNVEEIKSAGAQLCIAPNVNPRVVAKARSSNLVVMPGCFTATEAFTAIEAGADAIKVFPADVGGAKVIRALRQVLPHDVPLVAVGGVDADSIGTFRNAGAAAFGVGTAVFSPDLDPDTVAARAQRLIYAWRG